MKQVEKRGIELQDELKRILASPNKRTETHNPQTIWKAFKTETTKWVAQKAKMKHYKCHAKIRNLKKDQEETLTRQTSP